MYMLLEQTISEHLWVLVLTDLICQRSHYVSTAEDVQSFKSQIHFNVTHTFYFQPGTLDLANKSDLDLLYPKPMAAARLVNDSQTVLPI